MIDSISMVSCGLHLSVHILVSLGAAAVWSYVMSVYLKRERLFPEVAGNRYRWEQELSVYLNNSSSQVDCSQSTMTAHR